MEAIREEVRLGRLVGSEVWLGTDNAVAEAFKPSNVKRPLWTSISFQDGSGREDRIPMVGYAFGVL